MDMLTLMVIAESNPRAAMVYQGHLSLGKVVIECSRCALKWARTQGAYTDVGQVMENTKAYDSPCPPHCESCGCKTETFGGG